MSGDPPQIGSHEELLAAFQRILPLRQRPRTLLEIAKVPHSELAHSNILAHFLDPQEEHGLGDLVLRTLLQAAGSKLVEHELAEAKVIREDRTGGNKSIDIVVEGGSFVLGIENKIGAGVYNPLDDYWRRLQERAAAGKIPAGGIDAILLSLRKEEDGLGLHGFRPRTYGDFLARLAERLRERGDRKSAPGVQHLWEFIKTIENITAGTHMDPRFIKLVRRNQKTAVSFCAQIDNLCKELRQKAEELAQGVKLGRPFEPFGFWNGRSEEDGFCCAVFTDVQVAPDLRLRFEATVYLDGWAIGLWALGKHANKAKETEWRRDLHTDRKHDFYARLRPTKNFDLATVQAEFQHFIDKGRARIKAKKPR